jgi:hypothetical protein
LAFQYIITGLEYGTMYTAVVSAVNEEGTSTAQVCSPARVAPPVQKASPPTHVCTYTTVQSSTSITVSWMHPESHGGSRVSQYKIEWDMDAAFASNKGSPVGSYHFVAGDHDCSEVHCSFPISELETDTAYYIRVFAYNTHGHSVLPGVPLSGREIPKSAPKPSARVLISPVSGDSVEVVMPPSNFNGGSLITEYKIEYDVLGAEAYSPDFLTDAARSLLYSPYEVQVIESSADVYDLDGYFFLSFGGYASTNVGVTATAAELEEIL